MAKGVYQRGQTSFQVKFSLGEDRITQGGFKTEREAEAYILACQSAYKLGKPRPDVSEFTGLADKGPQAMTIEELYKRVDKKRWSGNPESKSGLKGQTAQAARFVKWCGPKALVKDVLTEASVEAFAAWCEGNRNSGSTITKYMMAISALQGEAVKLKVIPETVDLPKRAGSQVRLRVFDEVEEPLIFSTLKAWSQMDHYHLFAFLIDTAVRPIEAQRLEWADFIDKDARVNLESWITKNSTPRVLPLTPRAKAAVAYMRERFGKTSKGPFTWADPNLRATRSLWDRLRAHFSEWMGEDTVVYTFRHTCASKWVQRGVDLYKVQIALGHKSISMTQRYAKFAPKHLAELADVLT